MPNESDLGIARSGRQVAFVVSMIVYSMAVIINPVALSGAFSRTVGIILLALTFALVYLRKVGPESLLRVGVMSLFMMMLLFQGVTYLAIGEYQLVGLLLLPLGSTLVEIYLGGSVRQRRKRDAVR